MISLLLPLSEILFLLLCASSHECLSMAQNAPAQSWSFKAIPSDIRYLVPQHLLNSAYFKNSIKNLIYYSRVEKTLHEDIATLNGNNSFKVTFQHFINNISRYEKKSLIKFLAKAPQETILRAIIKKILAGQPEGLLL